MTSIVRIKKILQREFPDKKYLEVVAKEIYYLFHPEENPNRLEC